MKFERNSNRIRKPGTVKAIQSVSNPIIKGVRGLIAQRKHRRESGLFVAEGLKLATDAITAGWEIDSLIYCNDVRNQEAVSKIASTVHAKGGSLIEVKRQVLSTITRKDNPQMVVGVFKQKTTPIGKIQFEENSIWIGLERIRDPGNLGTIIRTADAVGASGVLLIGDSTDPFSVETVRATMGSIFHVPLTACTLEEFLDSAAKWSVSITGTHLNGKQDFRKVEYGSKHLLLMGNEQSGLSDELVGVCDNIVCIPQSGQADSLNVAIATGILLYEVCRERLVL